MVKLKYCVIKENSDRSIIVYVASSKEERLNSTISDNKFFGEVKKILKKHGFEHVMAMTFRSNEGANVSIKDLMHDMTSSGFVRSRKLESSIYEQRKLLDSMKNIHGPLTAISGDSISNTGIPTFSENAETGIIPYSSPKISLKKSVIKLKKDFFNTPKIGQKIDLYVYMFLRINPVGKRSVEFSFELDFYSKNNSDKRRFIKMLKCSFTRKKGHADGLIYFESDNTLKDFLKEIDFLFTISLFDTASIVSGGKPKRMVYNSIELWNYLNLEERVSLFIQEEDLQQDVFFLSEKIRKEKYIKEKNVKVPVIIAKQAAIDSAKRMDQRMNYYSDQDDFELAASYKKNIEYINQKLEILSSFENDGVKILSNDEYEHNFTMKDMVP